MSKTIGSLVEQGHVYCLLFHKNTGVLGRQAEVYSWTISIHEFLLNNATRVLIKQEDTKFV